MADGAVNGVGMKCVVSQVQDPHTGLMRETYTVVGDETPTAPTRASTFPKDATGRKQCPVASGVLDYFPDALVAIAHVSWVGNEQHNPGEPLHWARGKSTDEGDALIRHFLERGKIDSDGVRHSAKMAWRALALLQKEIEAEGGKL